jgi:hypothetical protein
MEGSDERVPRKSFSMGEDSADSAKVFPRAKTALKDCSSSKTKNSGRAQNH